MSFQEEVYLSPAKGGRLLAEDDALMGEKSKLSIWRKAGFGIGDMATAAVSAVMGFYLMVFLIEEAGVNPGGAGLILMFSKIWDAISDPIIGKLTDMTRTRWGRRRPWLLFGSLPYAIFYFAVWIVPPFSASGKFVYYLVIICLYNSAFTAVGVPYVALTPELADNYNERTSLTSFKTAFLIPTMMFITVVHSAIINAYNDNVKKGYLVSALMVSLIVFIAPLIVFVSTKEKPLTKRRLEAEGQSLGFVKGLKIVAKNKAFVNCVLLYLCDWIAISMIQANFILYVTYVWHEEAKFTLIILCVQGSTFIFIPIWAYLSARVGKKQVYITGVLVLAVSCIALAFVTAYKPVVVFPLCVSAGAGISSGFLIPWSMMPDVVDRDEEETGKRREGVFYGLFVFCQKSGLAGALAMNGFILDGAGYSEQKEIVTADGGDTQFQPDSVRTALRVLMGGIPPILLLLSIIPAYFYPITRERQEATLAILDERRTTAAKAEQDYGAVTTDDGF